MITLVSYKFASSLKNTSLTELKFIKTNVKSYSLNNENSNKVFKYKNFNLTQIVKQVVHRQSGHTGPLIAH
jgi:hypothetical protein